MGNRMRYGPRFNAGSAVTVRGTGYIGHREHWKEKTAPAADTKLGHCQKMSLKFREKKGIKPSLPRFSFDDPLPEPPKPPPEPDWLDVARKAFRPHICIAKSVIMVTDKYVLVAMSYDKKNFNACLYRPSGKIKWTEGPAPYVSRNGPSRRKDIT